MYLRAHYLGEMQKKGQNKSHKRVNTNNLVDKHTILYLCMYIIYASFTSVRIKIKQIT